MIHQAGNWKWAATRRGAATATMIAEESVMKL
jgi:hypothetical protein